MKRTHRAFLRHGLRLCLLVLLCSREFRLRILGKVKHHEK